MGEPPRGFSSNSLKSSKSGMSSNISIHKIPSNNYVDDHKAKIKRARTLKQEAADRVIEEDSNFDDSGSGFASDTPIAGKKGRNNENFGEAVIPQKRKIKKKQEDQESCQVNSISQSNIKVSGAGSVNEYTKKRVHISKIYPGMIQPKRRYYPTMRQKAIP